MACNKETHMEPGQAFTLHQSCEGAGCPIV